MKVTVAYSGGKDSLATIIYCLKHNIEFEVVFCDTNWEHEITYDHIERTRVILEKKGIKFTVLKSEKFPNGFMEMVKYKGRFPSTKAKFCTEELKIKPMIDYLLTFDEDITVYQGIRADESNTRSKMNKSDEYFRYYVEARRYNKRGYAVYDSYRRNDILTYIENHTVDVFRPIFNLTANDVFDIIKNSEFEINQLYKMGFKRVGCFPCIMCIHNEMNEIVEHFPETISKLKEAEKSIGKSFFPPNYIPERFRTRIAKVEIDLGEFTEEEIEYFRSQGKVLTNDNEEEYVIIEKKVPTVQDVITYVGNGGQSQMFDAPECKSVYNICE